MTDKLNYDRVLELVSGKPLHEIRALIQKEPGLSDWVEFADQTDGDALTAGRRCLVWVVNPQTGQRECALWSDG